MIDQVWYDEAVEMPSRVYSLQEWGMTLMVHKTRLIDTHAEDVLQRWFIRLGYRERLRFGTVRIKRDQTFDWMCRGSNLDRWLVTAFAIPAGSGVGQQQIDRLLREHHNTIKVPLLWEVKR